MSDQNSENLGGNGVCGAISGSEVDREGLGGGMTSGGSVVWGPAIAVDGKRPGWLCSGEWRRVRTLAVGEWQTADIESPGDTIPDMDEWNWGDIIAIRLPADHPHYRQPAPIDWSGELEAVHEDGRVVPARYDGVPKRFNGHKVSYDDGEGEWSWCVFEDGRTMIDQSWRIRNVTPQPTPQADAKPDVTARMIGAIRELAARDNGDGTVNLFEIRRTVQDAVEIVALLPEPVDPLEEAKTTLDVFLAAYDACADHALVNRAHDDDLLTYGHLRAISRALAGETGK